MVIKDLEKRLLEILEDECIDDKERQELKSLVTRIAPDKLRFLRNRGFDIAREKILQQPESSQNTLKWLEKLVKATDTSELLASKSSAHFSPGPDCRNKLLDLIGSAKKRIDICVFTISDDRLTEAIIKAYRKGINIKIITDNDKSEDRGSDIDRLIDAGVNIRMDATANHMHHKYMVVDHAVLANGSFNWTRSATERNEENILVTSDKQLVDDFQQKFYELWDSFQ